MAVTKTKTGKRIKVSPGTKGAISEHLATAWLLQQGYDVFRNVSPNGRADLLAIDWIKDETFRVDVKSQGFLNGSDERSTSDAERVEKNKTFDIKYIVVNDDLTCDWHDGVARPKASNDNKKPELQWWKDKKTLQRFPTPGNHMTNREWTFYCHWLIRAYPDFIIPFRVEWVSEMAMRYTGQSNPPVGAGEIPRLEKLFDHVYGKLLETEAIELVDVSGRAA